MQMIHQVELAPGQMELYSNNLPGLTAGSYEISVTQALPNAVTENFSTTIKQQFGVSGPQFVLSSDEVHAFFPPDNSNGNYGQSLPFVVLQSHALPWERLVTADRKIPWLALLILQSDEVTLTPGTDSPLISSSVKNFLAPDPPDPTVVRPDIDGSKLPISVQSQSMQSIRLSTAVFTAVTPRLGELSSLAHVRQIDPVSQAVADNGPVEFFSLVMANRFPKSLSEGGQPGAMNYAVLVSLEGLSPYLVDQPQWPQGAKAIQLACLAFWRFVSVPLPGLTFQDLGTALVEEGIPDSRKLLLRIPVGSSGTVAANRLNLGFTALSCHTLPGPDTFSWYRGPFTPYPAQPLPAGIATFRHPDQAVIYDQANAIFDNSYGAAWTIGRLTALADPVFVDALRRTRARVSSLSTRLLERSRMPHLRNLSMEELAAPGATRKAFLRMVEAGLGGRLAHHLAEKSPAQPASRLGLLEKSALFPEEELPASPAEQAKWFMSKPSVSSFLVSRIQEDISPMADWLAKLALLYNVPFNHLVPDQRMLPAESIRFFFVDPGWIKVLLDGAMTIGINSSREHQAHQVLSASLHQATAARIHHVRPKLLRRAAPMESSLPQFPAAGLLLRSALVSGFPGLQITATASGAPVNILRMDRLSPDVLLVLWSQVPDTISVSQPSQGILFGTQDDWKIPLRSLSGEIGKTTGQTFPATGNIQQYMRSPIQNIGGRVLNLVPPVAGTPGYLIPALSQAMQLSANLNSAQFSLEMIMAPEQIQWKPAV